MIANQTFCDYIAQKLGVTLFADYGEFVAAYRNHNAVNMPICGIFRMQPMTITPIQGLFIASATANVEIAAEAKDIAYVRSVADSLAANYNGEAVNMTDDNGKTYIVTCSYSTAYVGMERTAPNNTGKVIPISLSVYFSIVQNGVASNDVKVQIDGYPVNVTEFSISTQRVADSYTVGNGITSAAIMQGVRSFDFVTPLLSSNLGDIYKKAVFGNEGNAAHLFTIEIDGDQYGYICVFGNVSASIRAPQNVGCNISLLEGVVDAMTFGDGWTVDETNGSAYTLQPPITPSKIWVFWGDGTSELWDTTNGTSAPLTHVYASAEPRTVCTFTLEETTARVANADQEFTFHAVDGNMTASLFASDYVEGADGYWRRDCTIEWGDGKTDTYNTMASSFDDLPSGIKHTYEAEGEYKVKVYQHDLLWVSI